MTFAGCGTKAAYVKTMGNDGTPGPNPFGNDTKNMMEQIGLVVQIVLTVQEIQEVLEFKQQHYFLEDKEVQQL